MNSSRWNEADLKPGRRGVLRGLAVGGGALLGGLGTSMVAQAQTGITEAKLVEAAKREGQVTVYASSGPAVLDRLAGAFRSRYGIPVEMFRSTTGPVSARLTQEVAAKRILADVIQVADKLFFENLVQRNLIVPLDSLPAYSAWPERLKSRHWVLFSIAPNGILYNTKLVTAPLRDWPDLLDPRWRGQVLITDPNATIAVVALFGIFRRRYGDDFLRQLAAQKQRLIPAASGGELVAAGEAAIHFPNFKYVEVNLAKRGASVAFSNPEVTNGIERQIGAVAGSPHPNAGLLFVNFALSTQGQAVFNGDQQGASGLPNIPDTLKLPGGYVVLNEPEARQEKNDIMRLLGLN